MVTLDIANKTKSKVAASKTKALLNFAQRKLQLKNKQTVSLAFVGAAEMRRLNKKYRRIDKVTDVLSFNSWFDDNADDNIGEIIICSPRAAAQAKEYQHSLQKEVLKLVLHGYLHLLGYDHERVKDAAAMESLEENILKSFYVRH